MAFRPFFTWLEHHYGPIEEFQAVGGTVGRMRWLFPSSIDEARYVFGGDGEDRPDDVFAYDTSTIPGHPALWDMCGYRLPAERCVCCGRPVISDRRN